MDKVTFRVNGTKHSVGCEVNSTTTLLNYLRRTLELRGTKYMCLDGGCGACIVSAVKCHGEDPQGVNSCMVSITSCQDWDIKTIEKVGNRLDGYHPLQTTLAETNGSQCGYCSPGMIMNMYSLLQSKQLTMLEIEKSLGSNICRCTGYRPILETFKKFASDAPEPQILLDIEDLKICEKSGQACSQQKCEDSTWCFISKNEVENEMLHIKLNDNRDWYRVKTLTDMFDIWREKGVESYMLVAGNTSKGVNPILEYPRLLIDISCVSELKGYCLDQNLILGAGTTLTDVISIFTTVACNDGFRYLEELTDHLELVANVTIRNLATLAGNLIIKNQYPNFKSDIYILLETVGAQMTIVDNAEKKQILTMQAFLKEDMRGKLILNVILPPLSFENKVVFFKIMPRNQNAHAYVQAGFLYKINETNTIQKCRIVYGGLSPRFNRAFQTEVYLIGKKLFLNETLQGALKMLNKEMVVVENLLEPPVKYRRQAALGLFYKGLLSLCPSNILHTRYRTGAIKLQNTRPVSKGRQVFDTNPALWPLTEPITKVDALIQCAGEAKYTEDIPTLPGELFLAFVLAKIPFGTIEKIDSSRALREPGVIAFYSASDIPGVNSFIPSPNLYNTANEELFCNGEVKYYDQPIGVIVAETQTIANKAATLVQIQYTNLRQPIIDIKVAKHDPTRVSVFSSTDAKSKGNDITRVIKGNDTIYGQYHFTMETLVCVAHPTEEGLRIFPSSQWIDLVHQATSRVLNLDQSRIDVHLRRIGGAYGYKLTRSAQVAVATALASYKLNRPCRFINPLNVNMRAMGKRFPCSRDFEVGVNANGVIQYVNYDLYGDNGYVFNEPILFLGLSVLSNCYREDLWKYTAYNVITDTASNSWCRSPGTLENIAMAELMVERIAYELNLDPLEVRLANLDKEKYGNIQKMTETLMNDSQYAERKLAVDIFNKNNRWNKRGLRFCFLKWVPVGLFHFDVNLCVYVDDGTVVITHAGVEMGQGINTKSIQICAYLLNIPVENIRIKPNNTVIAPNGSPSGGSLATQNAAIGVRRCCEELLARLEPIRSQMNNPNWQELIKRAYDLQVDLQVHAYTTANDVQDYFIGGVSLAEVEIDVLTGEWQISRVDLIEDVGQSVNPELDVGQVEGAFIMGVGYWTCENLIYDSNTGEVLTNRTWDYWVPQARDIPQDFRIYFKRRSYSNDVIFGAKGTGEPATCMGIVVALAMRAAIAAARLDSGIPTDKWFTIVGSEVNSSTTLLEYLRHTLELRGTKYMCLEGGCGACIVSATKCNENIPQGVNSCMVSLTSCQGWDITTIEKVGNRLDGYHPLQTTLADTYGSQCGYCSPGMIMNMYSLLQSKQLTMLEIEKSLGSNICRCTGYRPILDAFKKFAVDAPDPKNILDIEDLNICEKSGKTCSQQICEESWCFISKNEVRNEILHIKLNDNRDWYKVNTLTDVFAIWREKGAESYMLVAGNTAKGVNPILEYPRLLIDISCVQDLQGYYLDQNLVLGAGITLTDIISIFTTVSENYDFSYLKVLVDHLALVAHVTIRNLATLAGNLMIKNQYPNFKSDIFILLETVGAQITILKDTNKKQVLTMQAFVKEDMNRKIILNVIFPPLSFENKIVTYKIMQRNQNAHALVQAGFLYKINKTNIVLECRIIYGGLSPKFNRAFETERYLVGKNLFVNETLQGALKILNKELVVVENLPEPPVTYRRQAALGLFYKGLLSLCPPNILNVRYRSGATKLHDTRSVSKGHQVFDTNPTLWPLNQAIPKVDALIQCAGEAKYTDDIPKIPGELFLAFVPAKVPLGTIDKIDPSRALDEPGVIAFYSASDIPGDNSFIPATNLYNTADEELFCGGEVKCYDQVIGIVIAKSQAIANKAATLVKIHYTNIRQPIIDIKVAKNDPTRISVYLSKDAKSTGKDIVKVIKGNDTIYGQYHFTMETLVCVAHPTEEGLKVFASSQWLDLVHQGISRVLKLDQSRIDVHVRRLGGGYGFKISRSSQVAVATAFAAYKLNRPCRFINSLNDNMRVMGKRFPCSRDFEVGVNAYGVIQYVNCDLYGDNGYIFNENILYLGLDIYSNCYRQDLWKYTAYNAVTDTASNTWCRAPGTLENIAMTEMMLERIAYELNLDPLEVRLANLDTENCGDIQEMTETLKNDSQYAERKLAVDIFNKNNRWKKRGLRFCYLKWVPSGLFNFDVNLSVYVDDGTVVITLGGVEMGQGINTKAIQICAYLLNIPVEKIQIKPNDTVIAPNCGATAASLASQNVAIGVRRCCEELLTRLEPIRSQMSNPTWAELIKNAYDLQVDLQMHAYNTANDIQNYLILGVSLAEVEIDVLTGECQILRVDLIEDVGQSVNPELDVGQVEGAFMMGVGYWTCENLVYDPKTGELLTNRTWEYWVPQARDIPQDFRIYFKRRSYSNDVIFGAKATGEPATCMSVVIALAMRAAIVAARLDSGIPTNEWFTIDGPYTVDKICVSTATRLEDFRFY